ncbi:hypothetical protein H0H24_09350 [Acinetobacter baumannii]|nr:hypothetical protein H0H24_09350 [Acinetobacter baumannii]
MVTAWTLANTLPALADGPHTITVTATDAAGNVGNSAVVTIVRLQCRCLIDQQQTQ